MRNKWSRRRTEFHWADGAGTGSIRMKYVTRKSQVGVVAIELAFLMVPLCLLAFGAAEYGRAIYQYNAMVKSTRDAVRFLSSRGPGNADDIADAKCMAVTGTTDCTNPPLVPGLTAAMVDVCDPTSCPVDPKHLAVETGSGTIDLVTVYIGRTDATRYTFQSIVPLPFGSGDIQFGTISATMRQ